MKKSTLMLLVLGALGTLACTGMSTGGGSTAGATKMLGKDLFTLPTAAQTPVITDGRPVAKTTNRAKVYFTRDISANGLKKIYSKINQDITGRIAIKLHTGEKNGPNILPRDMVKEFMSNVPNSTIVETNTLYNGDRYTTEGHRETLKVNGWTFSPVDIMDENDAYVNFSVPKPFHLKEVAMGKHIENYDSMLVLTHFKGHAMGGFGGSIKNIAIGNASGHLGKKQVHGVDVPPTDWGAWPAKEILMENMVDSANATDTHFGKHITYINVLRNMSVDCDCAGVGAAKPTIPDIGILGSTDILAADQASIDLVYSMPDQDKHDLKERIESRVGLRQLSAMEESGGGNRHYEIIDLDK